MTKPLSLFNWSLKKTLEAVPDGFIKARVRIIYTILVFALLKASVVAGFSIAGEQREQLVRALLGLLVYSLLVKILLSRPQFINALAHTMLLLGLVLVWTNIFGYIHKVNLATVQFIFMIVLSGFYTLGARWGIAYSVLGIAPVLLSYAFYGNSGSTFGGTDELASPAYEILVVLNFISITLAHYLFYKAFHANITEKEKLNEQLQLSIAEANKLAVSKSNFLSTMSHELRTPLNSVIGTADLLLADNPEERQKENLNILRYSSLDLLALINNILDFNKIDSGKPVMETVPFLLAEFLAHRCAGLRMKAKDKGLNFILDIDERLSNTVIKSDPTRLSQLIYNLAGNAIKFTEKGNVTVSATCVGNTEDTVDILFAVTDTGIGIHPDRHEAIFESFTQAESHITRQYGGTGLGLAIVKQIVTLFGSTIHLDSQPNVGTKFHFTISFALAPHIIETATKTEIKQDLSGLRILIAEDNELNRLIIRKQLDTLNIKPMMVENGQLAYEAYITGDYDAVFMDLHMPVTDGYTATKQIRALNDRVKANGHIIAFTATVNEQELISDAGFDDFLYKPVNMNDLRDKLNKIALLRQVQRV